MAEGGEGQKPVILDMDSERTAPVSKHKRPSLGQLTAEKEADLLAERARDDSMQGLSQEELNKQAEDRENLRSGIEDVAIPYEALFARRAAELHTAGGSRRIGGFLSPKYEVQDYTLGENGEREYPFKLRYHIKKNKDGGKEYVPDSYIQQLVLLDKNNALNKTANAKHQELQAQFKNGAINKLVLISPTIGTKTFFKEKNVPQIMGLPLSDSVGNPRNLLVDLSVDHPAIVLSGLQSVEPQTKIHYIMTRNTPGTLKEERVDQTYEMTSSGTFGPYPTKYKFANRIEYDNDGKDWGLRGKGYKRTFAPDDIGSGRGKDDFTVQKFLDLAREMLSLIPAKNLTEDAESSSQTPLPDVDTKKELEQGRKREMPPHTK